MCPIEKRGTEALGECRMLPRIALVLLAAVGSQGTLECADLLREQEQRFRNALVQTFIAIGQSRPKTASEINGVFEANLRAVEKDEAGQGDKAIIRIGVLLPMTGSWASGRTIAGAASMAIERINSDPTLLGGGRRRKPVVAELKWLDSGCSAGKGLESMMELLADTKVAAVIGPGAHSAAASCGNRSSSSFAKLVHAAMCLQLATMRAKPR